MTPETTPTDEAQARGAGEAVAILYTNWRGETAVRRLVPSCAIPFWWGESDYHKGTDGKPLPQWFFCAIDVDREEDGPRDFALSGIRAWGQEAVDAALTPATSGSVVVPAGWRLVPDKAARAWAEDMATRRQGRSSTPRSEPPGEADIDWCVQHIRDALAAAPTAPAAPARAEGDDLAGLSAAATVAFLKAVPSVPEEGFDCIWLEDAGGYRIGSLDGPQSSPGRVANAKLLVALWNAYRSNALIPATPTVSGTGERERDALTYFFKQFRQSVFAEYHGTPAVLHNSSDISRNSWIDAESARLLEVLLAAPPSSGPSQAARDVLAERRRQVEVEGWTPEHDDDHENGELAGAAAAYAVLRSHVGRLDQPGSAMLETLWPWGCVGWKPTCPRRDLVKAAALILAEIERLDRLSPPSDPARAAAPGGQTREA